MITHLQVELHGHHTHCLAERYAVFGRGTNAAAERAASIFMADNYPSFLLRV
jgi:hypothetical protein